MNYQTTIRACFVGYIVQAIVNNFVPLLFLTFQDSFGIPLSQITLLITFNFGIQLLTDLVSAGAVRKIGYRAAAVAAHILAAGGFLLLAVLPNVLPTPFLGLLIAVFVYAVGGGLLEVIVSPIVEACPTKHKDRIMSMLHSFYCWGQVGVVALSTLFFRFAGIRYWPVLALVWALIPFANIFVFLRVPIAPLVEEGEREMQLSELIRSKVFWMMLALMLCAGACELSVSQWASAFAEKGLGVSKTAGDLAGPMMFAVLMGLSRVFYGKFGEKIALKRFMIFSGLLCVLSYLIIALSPWPILSLVGCGLCGLSVGILWPGTFSLSAKAIRTGGAAMFALLALGGDVGCSVGPTLVGMVSGLFGDAMQTGILAAVIFPILLLVLLKGVCTQRNMRS